MLPLYCSWKCNKNNLGSKYLKVYVACHYCDQAAEAMMCCKSCSFPLKTFRITFKELRIQYSSKLSSLYLAKQEMVHHKKPSVSSQGSKTLKTLVLSSIKIITVCICIQNLNKYFNICTNTNSYMFFHSFSRKASLQYFVLEQLWSILLAGAVTDTANDC